MEGTVNLVRSRGGWDDRRVALEPRDGPAMVREVRTGLLQRTTPTPLSSGGQVAPGRGAPAHSSNRLTTGSIFVLMKKNSASLVLATGPARPRTPPGWSATIPGGWTPPRHQHGAAAHHVRASPSPADVRDTYREAHTN